MIDDEDDKSAEELAQIDLARIVEEMRDTPHIYGRYTERYVEADKKSAIAAIRVRALYSRLYLEYKVQGGLTDPGYKAKVECDERYIEAQMVQIKFTADAKLALHKTKALDKKLERLRDLAIRMNAEMKIDPLVLANAKKAAGAR